MIRATVVLRAEITKAIGPGSAYLLTRLYLQDGTILEQANPGLLDLDDGWTAAGVEGDLPSVAERLTRQGWKVSAPR